MTMYPMSSVHAIECKRYGRPLFKTPLRFTHFSLSLPFCLGRAVLSAAPLFCSLTVKLLCLQREQITVRPTRLSEIASSN